MRDVRADAGQAEQLGSGSRRGHRPVAADGGEPVHAVAARDLDERVDVAEVDGLRRICLREPERELVPVGDDDSQPGSLRVSDRRKLRDAPSEDQHRLHGSDRRSGCESIGQDHLRLTGRAGRG